MICKNIVCALATIAWLTHACGSDNQLSPYIELSKAERARKALDEKDYDTAATLYGELVEENPREYITYTLYATALAGRGGISLLSVVLDQLSSTAGGGGSGSSGVLTLIDKIVPENVTDEGTASVKTAVEILQVIPSEAFESDTELSTSAKLQMTVYSAVYTAMLMDSLLNIQNGQYDPESLRNLTVDQATAILEAFILAGSVGDADSPLTKAMSGAGSSINGASGEDAKAKLQAYLGAS